MTSTLRSAALWYARLPRRNRYVTHAGEHAVRDVLIVRIDVDGHVGSGEFAGDGPRFGPETLQTAAHILRDHLVPLTAASSFTTVAGACAGWQAIRGHHFAKAALECALWDAIGRARGLSLRALLAQAGAPPLCDRVPVGASMGLHETPARTVAQARRLMAFHPPRIKIKIAPGHDLAHVRAVRAALPDVPLMVDANGAYTRDDADVFHQLDTLGLMMIEQPLAADDLVGSARLQRELRTPICLDEGIESAAALESAIALRACGIVNVKPGRLGGLLPTLGVHAVAQQHGIKLWCGGMFETGIGRALNAHAAALPGFVFPADCTPPQRAYGRDIIAPGLTFGEDSMLDVPHGPGLGVNVDESGLRQVLQRIETVWG